MDYTPLYVKIKQYLIEKIESGEFQTDEKLPSEKDLCDMFDVSRITVNTAMKDLVKENYVYREKGKGTFVKNAHYEKDLNHLLNYAFEDAFNRKVKVQKHITLEVKKILPSSEIADRLNLDEGEQVNEIIRLRTDNDKPMSIEYIYIPVKAFGDFHMNEKLNKQFMHHYLAENLNIEVKQIKVFIKTGNANKLESEKFNVPLNSPLLFLENIMVDRNKNVLVFSKNAINDRLFNFYIDIHL